MNAIDVCCDCGGGIHKYNEVEYSMVLEMSNNTNVDFELINIDSLCINDWMYTIDVDSSFQNWQNKTCTLCIDTIDYLENNLGVVNTMNQICGKYFIGYQNNCETFLYPYWTQMT